MAFLKVLLWIMLILLILVVFIGLVVVLALSVKVGIGVGYETDGPKLKVKYGLLGMNLMPLSEKKKARGKKIFNFIAGHGKNVGSKIGGSAKNKAIDAYDKQKVIKDIKQAEELTAEATRLQEEEARLNAEMKKAEERLALAEQAEKEGNPLPLEDIQVENKYAKLLQIRDNLQTLDIESAYINARSFMDGFSYSSVVALMQLIGSEGKKMGGKLGKRILIKTLKVKLRVAGPDAAATAMKCGKVGAVCFPAFSKLVKTGRVKNYDLSVDPDFHAKKSSADFALYISFRPIRILGPVGAFGIKAGKNSFSVVSENATAISDAKSKRVKEREEKLLRQTAAQAK